MRTGEEFLAALDEALAAKGVSAQKMSLDLGYDKSLVSTMRKRKTLPTAETLGKIAEYLSVTSDHLLGLGSSSVERAFSAFLDLPREERLAFVRKAAAALAGDPGAKGMAVIGLAPEESLEADRTLERVKKRLEATVAALEEEASAGSRRDEMILAFLALPLERRKAFLAFAQDALERAGREGA